MNCTNFVIVAFVDEGDALDIVASNWIKDAKTCYYPNVGTDEMKDKLLRRMTEPEDTWPQYPIKILKSYKTYGEARLNLKNAEETCNLDSDEEVRKRKRKIKNIFLPEDSIKKKGNFSKYSTPKHKPVGKKDTPAEEVDADSVEFSNDWAAVDGPVITNVNVPTSSNQDINYLSESSSDTVYTVSSKQTRKTQPCLNKATNHPSGCAISKNFVVQQGHLIQVMTDLTNQITELNRKVDLLLEKHTGETCITHPEDDLEISQLLESLPVKDDASFCHFNDQLKINRNKQATISYLRGIGGSNVRTLTMNLLRKILVDEVAQLYSFTGKKMKNSNKKPFHKTKTCEIIYQLCKKVFEDVTEEDLKEIIKEWLNQAKVRKTRRAERSIKCELNK